MDNTELTEHLVTRVTTTLTNMCSKKNCDKRWAHQERDKLVAEMDGLSNIAYPTASQQKRFEILQAGLEKISPLVGEIEQNYERQKKADLAALDAIDSTDATFSQTGKMITCSTKRTFAAMFPGMQASDDGFESFGEFMHLITSGLNDERLVAASGMKSGGMNGSYMVATATSRGDEGSGYLIPTQYTGNLFDMSLEQEIVRPRASVVPMTSGVMQAPAWDNKDHSAGSIGGLKGEWVGEGETATGQAAKWRGINLKAKKLIILAPVSYELLADTPQLQTQLFTALAEASAFNMDNAFLNGTGSGQPLGILNDPTKVTVSKTSGQAAGTITYANLCNMLGRHYRMSNAVWVANPDTIPQLCQLFATDGTTSTHVPVLREDGEGGFTILTRPVIFTEKVPTLGQEGDIALVDFSQYMVGMRATAVIQKSEHAQFEEDVVTFRLRLRADGMGKWDKAITPKNGSSKSWVVTLEAR